MKKGTEGGGVGVPLGVGVKPNTGARWHHPSVDEHPRRAARKRRGWGGLGAVLLRVAHAAPRVAADDGARCPVRDARLAAEVVVEVSEH